MEITEKSIAEKYDEFKNLYFNTKIMPSSDAMKFKVTKTKTFFGRAIYNNKDYIIEISDYFNRSEEAYNTTLLHEMIHIYVFFNGLNAYCGRSGHDGIFKREAARIRAISEGKYCVKRNGEIGSENDTEINGKTFPIIVFKKRFSDRLYVAKCSDCNVRKLVRELQIMGYSCSVARSKSVKYARIKASRTRIHYIGISMEEYQDDIKNGIIKIN